MKWFTNVDTIETLKKQYKILCKKYHPDLNTTDTTKTMQEINNEYEEMYKKLTGTEYNKTEDKYAKIINKIIKFDINIEIIGDWIWCYNAYEARHTLKKLGFKFSKRKKAWYWHEGAYIKRSKKSYSLEMLRDFYTTQNVKEKKEQKKIAAIA